MIKCVSIRDIMVTNPLTVSADTPIVVATRSLLDNNYSGVPVVDDAGKLIGVLSKRDCLQAALNAHYHHDWTGKVTDYMVKEIKTLDPDTELTATAIHFINSRFRRFPVTENGLLVGQISRTDVLKALYIDTDKT